jgi:hypothetical protein
VALLWPTVLHRRTMTKWGREEHQGDIKLNLDFLGPPGVKYPQRQPEMDSFDEVDRIVRALRWASTVLLPVCEVNGVRGCAWCVRCSRARLWASRTLSMAAARERSCPAPSRWYPTRCVGVRLECERADVAGVDIAARRRRCVTCRGSLHMSPGPRVKRRR